MTFTQEWQIDCPPHTAFDLMADLRNVTEWNETCEQADMTSDEPVRHGSKFHLVIGGNRENDVAIARFDRPDRLEFAGTSKPMDIYSTYTFAPADGGTRMRGTFEPTPKRMMKLLLPLIMPMIRRDLAKHHAKFKTVCETQSRSRHAPERHTADES